MKKNKRWTIFPIWILLLALVSGCGQSNQTTQLNEGQYYTYYINSSGTALVSRIYEPTAEDTEGILAELLLQCQTGTTAGEGRGAIPSNVTVTGPVRLEDGVARIDFDTTYTTMSKLTELLCRAALAKTLTQVEGVDYITIYVNEKPHITKHVNSSMNNLGSLGENGLLDDTTETEAEPELWSGSDFLDNTGDDTNKYVQADIVLYFSNKEGTALVEEKRSVVYSSSLTLSRVILNQLIQGPQDSELVPTLPSGLKVQGVSVREGICYVDFDASFLEVSVSVTEAVEIYSIVNSLTELDNIKQVQITVNGSANAALRNNISLSTKFERDLHYLEEEQRERDVPIS